METTYYDLKPNDAGIASRASMTAQILGQQIVASQYEPGQLIEDEGALAERFSVSRSVVRDAVKILVGKGLLEVRRGIGTRVRDRNKWGLLDNDVLAWSDGAQPSGDRLFSLLEMRKAIEPRAAELAALNGDKVAIALIEQAVEEMKANSGTVDGFILADAHFHGAVLRATGNEFFAALEGVIFSALLASIRATNSDEEECRAAVDTHITVYEAIARGDSKAAEKSMLAVLGVTEGKLTERLQINGTRSEGVEAHAI